MTLDTNNHSLSYQINGKDYGIIGEKYERPCNSLTADKYRLVLNLYDKTDIVQLL